MQENDNPTPSTRKFYRTVYTVEVLSEEPIEGFHKLKEIAYMITEGDCSGKTTTDGSVEIDAKTAATLLMEQGSDPEYFRLDEHGNDIEDD